MNARLPRRAALLLVVILALSACQLLAPPAPPTPSAAAGEQGLVTHIVDGDTIDVLIDGQEFRVRYIGVNTPERDEPCYADATDANAALVRGQSVTLVKDVRETDVYDRLLRYIYVGDVFVNAALVEAGYAESVHYPPDTAHAAEFDQLAAQARADQRGCWPTGVFD
jgi:micrococcal nuclease